MTASAVQAILVQAPGLRLAAATRLVVITMIAVTASRCSVDISNF
jgi:hypothetical protein